MNIPGVEKMFIFRKEAANNISHMLYELRFSFYQFEK